MSNARISWGLTIACAATLGCALADPVAVAEPSGAPREAAPIDAGHFPFPDAALEVDGAPALGDDEQPLGRPADAGAKAVDGAANPPAVDADGADADGVDARAPAPDVGALDADPDPDPDPVPAPDAEVAPDAALLVDAAPPVWAPADRGGPDVASPSDSVLSLKINEIDYDQPGADAAEFVEIVNVGGVPVALGGVVLEFINGANGERYGRVMLEAAGVLPPGGYLVVGGAAPRGEAQNGGARVMALPNSPQNGPNDGVRLVTTDGRWIDGLAYEGELAGVGEGVSPTVTDDGGDAELSLGRCPDGADTDRYIMDFARMPATPGTPNRCD